MAKEKAVTVDFKQALKYIRGAVDPGQFVPAFKNYAISGGTIQGTDGIITLNAPVDSDLSICVDANKFVRTIMTCNEEGAAVEISQTDTGNLRVKQGKFRAVVPATPDVDTFPWSDPEGARWPIPDNFMEALRELQPFIGTDATRPWSMGVLIRNGRLYVTNNVVLVRATLSDDTWNELDGVIIPSRAVEELLRLAIQPKAMLVSAQALTFMHSRSWWMKTTRINGIWPTVDTMIDDASAASNPLRIEDDLRDGIQRLLPFARGAAPIYLLNGQLATSLTYDEDGAAIDGFDSITFALSAEVFKLILGVATHFEPSQYPKPVYFVGANVAGLAACYTMTSAGPAITQPVEPAKKRK